jgi:hypothetical protein
MVEACQGGSELDSLTPNNSFDWSAGCAFFELID